MAKNNGREEIKKEIKEGIAKGRPTPMPKGAMRGGKTEDRCRHCTIATLNGQAFPAKKSTATGTVKENVAVYTLTATTNPPDCPCTWSNEVYVEYVAVLAGPAGRLKRKNFMMPQILELMKISAHDANNPYVKIAGCTMTIQISDLNADLRAGINTQHAFFKGVPMRLKLGVKCNSNTKTIIIEIADA